jgi:hypothetical protein
VTEVTEATVVVVVEEAVILGEEVVVIETLIVAMAEALIGEAPDTLGHQGDAIHEIEAHSEGLQGNQILMYPVAAQYRDETTVPELLPPNLDRHLLQGQTLVPHLVAVSVLPRDHARRPLAGDLEHQTGEETTIVAVEGGEEEEAQTVHPVEDHPLLRHAHAHAPQGHRNEELLQTLLVHRLHPDLDELVATLVPCLGHLLGHLAGHLVEECLAVERGLGRLQLQLSRRMLRICVLGVVNAG